MDISCMLARNARRFPNKVALVERTPSRHLRIEITWKEMDDRVNRLANALIARGIGHGDMVLQWMMNSIKWLEVYLGIVRTGACAAPLNFRFTASDFRYCVDIAEPKAVILDEEFLDRARQVVGGSAPLQTYIAVGEKTHKPIDNYENVLAHSSVDPVTVEIGPEDPCGLYFTSGTTGAPKPILLTHQNLENAAITEVIHDQKRPGEIFVILKPLYHTGDKIHWLSSLILGETAVIQREKINPEAIFRAIHEEKGNIAMMLVPWLQDTLSDIKTGQLRKEDYDLSSWRLVLLGAQPVPSSLIEAWHSEFPKIEYEVNYGLSEASGPGCIHLGIGNYHKLGALGVPGFNWEVRLVDSDGRDVNPGEVGEIVVKGNGVMKEYYKNPEKTAATIKQGWLFTGDLGRIDADGFIWPADRKKDLIICGGENVYPSEVEEVLQTHPSIGDVAVIGLADQRMGEIVAAVIDLKHDCFSLSEEELENFCELHLPRYKRPRRFIFDRVPRSATGKIEKENLRKKHC